MEEPKFRIIHDLTFAAGAKVRSSVNGDTDFDQAPECLLGHVLSGILSRIAFLRQLHGVSLEILLCRVDVKDAFRQILVDPSGASAFGYTMGEHAVIDLRCQFGWRSSPGFWSLFSSAVEHVAPCALFARACHSKVGHERRDRHPRIAFISPHLPKLPLARDIPTALSRQG